MLTVKNMLLLNAIDGIFGTLVIVSIIAATTLFIVYFSDYNYYDKSDEEYLKSRKILHWSIICSIIFGISTVIVVCIPSIDQIIKMYLAEYMVSGDETILQTIEKVVEMIK